MAWPLDSSRTKTWTTETLFTTDLHTQFDILHDYQNDSMDGTTGHGHTGGTNDGKQIDLATAVTGALPLANGGTGMTTLASLGNLFYPVGSVYINYSNSSNPSSLLGFGTWVAISGFIAGIDGSVEFLTSGQTGGAKTVNLAHTHDSVLPIDGWADGSAGTGGRRSSGGGDNRADARTITSTSAGSATQAILPPYTVMYTWRRTV